MTVRADRVIRHVRRIAAPDAATDAALLARLLALLASALLAMIGGVALIGNHDAADAPVAAESQAEQRQVPMPVGLDPAPRDAHGDPLPAGAVARMGTLRFRHWFPISDVAYSPNGKLLATAGSADHRVRLWEAATGRLLASIPGEQVIVFTPDGKRLFHVGGNVNADAKVLDVDRRHEEDTLIPVVNARSLAMSPDGRWLALDILNNAPPFEVRVCDAATGKIRCRLNEHQKLVSCVAFSPDGNTIATAGDEAIIRLWDAATGKPLHTLAGHKPAAGYSSHVLTVAFAPDSKRLVSGGIDKTVRLWDVASGQEIRRLGTHKMGVLAAAFTPDGKQVLTGGFSEPMRLWNAQTGVEVRRFPKRSEHAARITFAPGGKTFAVAHWGFHAPRFWELATGREVPSPSAPELETTGIAYARDGRTVSTASSDGVIRHWAADTGREIGRWEKLPPNLNGLELSPDGRIMAAGDMNGTITLWQADSGRELRRLKGPRGWVLGLTFAPDGRTLASASSDGSVLLWDVASGTELRRCKGHQRYVRGVAFTPDGKTLASVAEDQTVRLWRVETGEELRRLKTREAQNTAIALSPDGRLLVVASTGEKPMQMWDLATSRELPPIALPGNQQRIFALAFAPDARTLASGGEDGVVRIWEIASGKERRRCTGHTGWAHHIRFAPDGKRVASASNDTTAVVWDVIGLTAAERKRAAALTDEQASVLWSELAGDAERADRAMRVLAAAAERTVPLLQRRLKPAARIDPAQVQRWIAQLDADGFVERDDAARDLAALDERAVAALRAALPKSRSLEQRRRIEGILERASLVKSAQVLQALRAVEVLERIGSVDARRVLAALAEGASDARLTVEARASIARLAPP